jgi:4-hydroxymandelate oxidase
MSSAGFCRFAGVGVHGEDVSMTEPIIVKPDGESKHPVLRPVCVDDYASLAQKLLPPLVWDYIAGAAGEEYTAAREKSSWRRWLLRPRVLVDVAQRDLSTTVLGRRVEMPLGIAPTSYHCLLHPDGETATVAAAGREGVLSVVAMFASQSIEDVAAAATGPWWLQLYPLRDRTTMVSLVRRAEAAGAAAVVLTVDGPLMGRRRRDLRNTFQLPPDVAPVNLREPNRVGLHDGRVATSAVATASAALVDASATWEDLAGLCTSTHLPMVVKGITHPADARRAVDAGVSGMVVSTHGGRQVDGMYAAAEVLPEIVAVVGDRCEVLVDGGIRSGGDVLRALALGARAVLVGRPVLWGLAAGGEDGVRAVLRIYRDELDTDLALCGYRDVTSVTPELLTADSYP